MEGLVVSSCILGWRMLFSSFLSNLHLNLKHQQIFIKLFLEEGATTELVCLHDNYTY